MAKAAFRVEDGIIPGHTDNTLGHSTAKFKDVHLHGQVSTNNINASGDVNVTGDLDVDGSTTLINLSATGTTINLPNFDGGGGGGGGGVSQAQAIAFAVALG